MGVEICNGSDMCIQSQLIWNILRITKNTLDEVRSIDEACKVDDARKSMTLRRNDNNDI